MQDFDQNRSVFCYFLLLTAFFLLLEVSFFIQCNETYLADFQFVSESLNVPINIIWGIIFFIFAQLFIHFCFVFFIWLVFLGVNKDGVLRIRTGHCTLFLNNTTLVITIWLLAILTVMIANHYYFPHSKFHDLTELILFNRTFTQIILILCCLAWSIIIIIIASRLIIFFTKNYHAFIILCLVALGSLFIFSFSFLEKNYFNRAIFTQQSMPNIILIGVDSLRPDFLGFFGQKIRSPFFDDFLHHATAFKHALTPLARTFPSWTSILLSQYPNQSGVRFNLAPQDNLNLSKSLAKILRWSGYRTIYATDETRFSNIDKNFGFDEIITPPMGINDFLLGTFNDFPLSNLIINTILGKWLFPNSYANRAVYFTYDPSSFLKLIEPALYNRQKPLFLAVHFCLPHYPYLWIDADANKKKILVRYLRSIEKVDEQIQNFYQLLNKYELLNHAIVVLLSDHGEALELPGDRITEENRFLSNNGAVPPIFYPPNLEDEEFNKSAGHGTDVLGLSQYYSLLAFRLYGLGTQHVKKISTTVSVLDIKPTLLALLGIKDASSIGISLISIIRKGRTFSKLTRHFFLESDFSPEAIRTVYPDTRKVLLEGIELFKVDRTTDRLIVKNKMGKMIIHSKQYADIYGDWILALYPQNKYYRMPILVNLRSGNWTNDLQSDFAQKSPAKEMLKELKSSYGEEIGIVD